LFDIAIAAPTGRLVVNGHGIFGTHWKMALQGGDLPEGRRSSESSGGNSWLSQETVKDNQTNRYQRNHAMLNGRLISPFTGSIKLGR
jgi:hypothetical protein